ncbi:hypothetical protein MMC07_003375 [Pseudocyphellaria aurata]|nr:hypothetical protein [Pseudocyphellaria aurata]
MAHHEDDQAECVLLRLAQGHRCMGLRGMEPVKRIPECWGIHGVYESGLKEEIEGLKAGKKSRQERPKKSVPSRATIPFEDGGVTIHRPLLGFSKNRLRATCEAMGVNWVEDETNRDPTRTPRNAIRQLLREGSLPRSLQKPSLLALKDRMGAKATSRTARANAAFEACDISMLDTRVGGMVVRLPSRVTGSKIVPPAYRQESLIGSKYKAALLLRQLLEIVSPRQDTIALPKLDFAMAAIFPDIKNPAASDLDKILLPGQFTTNGVSFQRVRSSWQRPTDRNATKSRPALDKEFIWVLTRQPFFSSENPIIEINPSPKYPTIGSQPSSPLTRAAFRLWDSRYWIRVYNPTSSVLRVQPLRDTHLSQLRSSYNAKERKALNDLLRVAAPGKVRYTLPVLLQEQNGAEKVVALPTLGVANPKREMGVEWEVRYKKLTLPRKTDIPRVVI